MQCLTPSCHVDRARAMPSRYNACSRTKPDLKPAAGARPSRPQVAATARPCRSQAHRRPPTKQISSTQPGQTKQISGTQPSLDRADLRPATEAIPNISQARGRARTKHISGPPPGRGTLGIKFRWLRHHVRITCNGHCRRVVNIITQLVGDRCVAGVACVYGNTTPPESTLK